MVDLLNTFKDEGLNIEFLIPAGGMALWVNVGGNAQNIVRLAKKKGIFLVAENTFHIDKSNDQDKFIRLGFAGQNEQQLTEGLLLLKPLLKASVNNDTY